MQFNKPIQPETFTHEDLFMRCQGKNVDMSTVSITSDDNTNFILDMGTTTQEDGYYVLDVHTNGILDNENFAGKNGKKADWIQYDGGLVNLAAKAYPANAGKLWITYEDNSGQESGAKRLPVCLTTRTSHSLPNPRRVMPSRAGMWMTNA